MLSKNTFDFLRKLEKNNNRQWFQTNKAEFDEANQNFIEFVNKLIKHISVFDNEMIGTTAKDCVFRIFRDVRFSKNKEPYKTNFGAYLAPGGRKSALPGYYIHVDPWQSFTAGGSYCPDPPQLLKIRQHIVSNTEEFFTIIGNPKFKQAFGEISPHNEKLVNVPKGFPKDHQAAEYLKYKNFIASCEIAESEFRDLEKLAARFQLMKPLNDFLRNAVAENNI